MVIAYLAVGGAPSTDSIDHVTGIKVSLIVSVISWLVTSDAGVGHSWENELAQLTCEASKVFSTVCATSRASHADTGLRDITLFAFYTVV